ncbi:hypothetical protein Tco_1067883 [Tanacetum coccineum]|uniref:Uncharacterized protein n=1 Tax=Tanacetum coccineum TaxID=301880 RepID=A0ABQ5HE55_9ASTR
MCALWDCKFACSSEEQKIKIRYPFIWALVHSRDSNDVRVGDGLLHGSLTSTSNFREKKKELYLLAVGSCFNDFLMYDAMHNHTFYRMKYTQSISIRPVHISWDSILMMVSCLIVGAYTKWIGGALSGLSFLPSVIGILVSGISMSEDSAVAAALAFRTFVMICWVEERIVEGSIEGSVVHIQGVRTVIIRPSGAISSYGLVTEGKGRIAWLAKLEYLTQELYYRNAFTRRRNLLFHSHDNFGGSSLSLCLLEPFMPLFSIEVLKLQAAPFTL